MRYAKYLYCGLLAVSLAFPISISASAQTAADQPGSTGLAADVSRAAGAQETLIKENLFTVSPALETELHPNTAVPVELRFSAQPNTSEAVDIDGITAEGFTRIVRVNGEQIAQVVVTRLKKAARFVDLEADDFTSQFGVDSNRLLPTTAISVNGDEAEFVQAVARLSDAQDKAEPEEELEDKADTAAEETGVDEAGGSRAENPVAGGYETPERLEPDEKQEREPNVTYNVTTEGCEPQIDLVSGVVRQQSLSQTLEDGIVTETDACAPNGVVFPIQKNYEVCEDIVDRDGLVATPQYASYYNDDKGARYDLAGCQADDTLYYVINEDYDACTPDMDFAGEKVTVLSQLSYRGRGGKKVIVTECEASDRTFEMEREYGTCGDLVELEKGTANAQYSLFYVDGKASRHSISECMPDDEKSFEIVEKQNCTFDFDFDQGKAVVNTSLAYLNSNNFEVSVRECAPSETIEPIRMTADTSNCTKRHDFVSGVSLEMAMWTYEHDGQLFQASPCITTETTYTHSKVFEKNGIDVCTPIVDLAKGQAARQYRTEITVNGRNEVVAGCQPDESAMMNITATTDGCEDPSSFDHDLAAGLSYGRERYYYTVPGQGRAYVTGCQKSDQTFTHSVSPNGWKYNDADLRAQQLVDVSINVNGASYQIATSYLQPGTTEIAYSFLHDQDDPDYSRKYYEGCDEMVPTNRTRIYARPDGSTYSLPSGSGNVINAGDKCQRSVETRQINNLRVWVAVKGYTATIKDGRGRSFIASNGCGTGGKSFSGSGPYSVISQSGPASGCRHPSNDVRYSHRVDERTKITYPTGEVTYTEWQTARWVS